MRALLLILSLLLSTAVLAAGTIYKWKDAKGVTHYSDQPHPGAEVIQLESAQTYSTPTPPTPRAPTQARTSAQDAGPVYQLCAIDSPAHDQVLFNVSTATVRMRTTPALRSGDRAVITLDGQRVAEGLSNEFTLSPVYRGTHTLVGIVENAEGQVLCRSPAITFHVRQPSVKAPHPANRPRF